MGTKQFRRRQDVAAQTAETLDVDVKANRANQYDEDVTDYNLSNAPFETGEQGISGSQEVSGGVDPTDADGNSTGSVSVIVEWMDGSGNVILTQKKPGLQDLTEPESFNFITKSTHVNVKLEGTATDLDATVNAH